MNQQAPAKMKIDAKRIREKCQQLAARFVNDKHIYKGSFINYPAACWVYDYMGDGNEILSCDDIRTGSRNTIIMHDQVIGKKYDKDLASEIHARLTWRES
ncbi:MAG: hypothetical protein WCO89_00110 [Syntrophus sp. (in: bacteria)]